MVTLVFLQYTSFQKATFPLILNNLDFVFYYVLCSFFFKYQSAGFSSSTTTSGTDFFFCFQIRTLLCSKLIPVSKLAQF